MAFWLHQSPLARMRTAEVNALWQLYEQSNGWNWTENTNWDPAKDPCRFFRVKKPHLDEQEVWWGGEWYEPTPWYGVTCMDPCDDYLDGDACFSGRATALRLRAVCRPPLSHLAANSATSTRIFRSTSPPPIHTCPSGKLLIL